MTGYLGRLVDRAVGPPASGARPRLAPVFPLGRPNRPDPAALESEAPSDEVVSSAARRKPVEQPLRPASAEPGLERAEPGVAALQARERPEPQLETPTPVAPKPTGHHPKPLARPPDRSLAGRIAPKPEPSTERSPTRPGARRAAEPRPEPPRAIAQVRVERHERLPIERGPGPQAQARHIEVRIGRVEVRRPSPPEPVESLPQGPAAVPPADAGFGELAAARRYLDRRWS